jgi:hypothetical protein
MQKNPEAIEQVYSFFNGTTKVTKKGKTVTAVFSGVPVTDLKSGNTLVAVSFVEGYPELIPDKFTLTCGLFYKSNSANYIATVEVNANGRLLVMYKDAVNSRSSNMTADDYYLYATMSWVTAN